MRLLLVLALVLMLVASPGAFADGNPPPEPPRKGQAVKPDAAGVARARRSFARAAAAAAGSAEREAALTEVRAAPRIERFEALARESESGAAPASRLLAVEELSRTGERAAVAVIVQAFVREPDRPTRAAMSKVLAGLEAAGGAVPAGTAGALFPAHLEDSDPRRRVRAMQGISAFRHARAVPALVALVESIASGFGRAAVEFTVDRAYISDWQLVSGGTGLTVVEVADPEVDLVRTGVSMDVQVRRVEMRFAVGLLRDLTGEAFGADPAAWRAWLKEHPDAPPAPP